MGRKVHPIGFRLGINKPWLGKWYAEGQEYTEQLHQDLKIRDMLSKDGEHNGISGVFIERFPGKVKVTARTAKPGILIGRKGENIKKIKESLEAFTGMKIDLAVEEIKQPDLDAFLVAQNIAGQITRRISYRRAMKRAMQQAFRQGAEGIKITVSGRLSGAEMARTVTLREGRVPQQTLRADIDFARVAASTTYGQIGIKVWIYRGMVKVQGEENTESTEGVYVSE